MYNIPWCSSCLRIMPSLAQTLHGHQATMTDALPNQSLSFAQMVLSTNGRLLGRVRLYVIIL